MDFYQVKIFFDEKTLDRNLQSVKLFR